MHVVFGNMTLDDVDIHGLGDLPDQIPNTDCHLSMKDRLAVFRDPHDVELDVVDGVRCFAVMLHDTASLLKSSPKGEGFSPIPRRGQ